MVFKSFSFRIIEPIRMDLAKLFRHIDMHNSILGIEYLRDKKKCQELGPLSAEQCVKSNQLAHVEKSQERTSPETRKTVTHNWDDQIQKPQLYKIILWKKKL